MRFLAGIFGVCPLAKAGVVNEAARLHHASGRCCGVAHYGARATAFDAGDRDSLAGTFRQRLTELYRAEGERQALLIEAIHGIATIKSLGLEPIQARAWDQSSANAIERRIEVGRIAPQITWGTSPEHVIGVDGRIPDPATVDDTITGDFHQERPKLRAASEPPALVSETREQVRPNRLHDVHRVELGPQPPAQLAAHRHPQVGLVGQEGALGSRGIAGVEPLDQLLQIFDTHGSVSARVWPGHPARVSDRSDRSVESGAAAPSGTSVVGVSRRKERTRAAPEYTEVRNDLRPPPIERIGPIGRIRGCRSF